MMKQYESTKKNKIDTNRQITSSASKRVDSNYMITEMKQLLKENTTLKQENLLLKQQIMLSKIQIQNLQLKLEQALSINRQNLTQNMIKKEQTNKDFPKKQISERIKLKSEFVKQKIMQKELKQKEQSALNMFKPQALKQVSQNSMVSNTTNTTEKNLLQDKKVQCLSNRNSLIKRDGQVWTNIDSNKNQRNGRSLSRKQQIMNKYRPFLDITNTFLAQKIETINSYR